MDCGYLILIYQQHVVINLLILLYLILNGNDDRLLFFVGNTGGPGYVAGQIEYNGRTYQTDPFNERHMELYRRFTGIKCKRISYRRFK